MSLDELSKKLFPDFSLNALNEYATTRRYEEGTLELDQEDLDTCIRIAEEALKWAEGIVKTK